MRGCADYYYFGQHSFADAKARWLFSVDILCSALIRRCKGALIIIILASTCSQMQRCTDFFLSTFFVQHSFVDARVRWWSALVRRYEGVLSVDIFCSALVCRCEGALIIMILASTCSQMRRGADFFLLSWLLLFFQHSFADAKVRSLFSVDIICSALIRTCEGALFVNIFLFSTRS